MTRLRTRNVIITLVAIISFLSTYIISVHGVFCLDGEYVTLNSKRDFTLYEGEGLVFNFFKEESIWKSRLPVFLDEKNTVAPEIRLSDGIPCKILVSLELLLPATHEGRYKLHREFGMHNHDLLCQKMLNITSASLQRILQGKTTEEVTKCDFKEVSKALYNDLTTQPIFKDTGLSIDSKALDIHNILFPEKLQEHIISLKKDQLILATADARYEAIIKERKVKEQERLEALDVERHKQELETLKAQGDTERLRMELSSGGIFKAKLEAAKTAAEQWAAVIKEQKLERPDLTLLESQKFWGKIITELESGIPETTVVDSEVEGSEHK